MRGGQREKTTVTAKDTGEETTDGGRAEVKGGKDNKSLIIYLEDTSSLTFSSGQWCSAKNKMLWRMLYSVGKVFHMISLVCTIWSFVPTATCQVCSGI